MLGSNVDVDKRPTTADGVAAAEAGGVDKLVATRRRRRAGSRLTLGHVVPMVLAVLAAVLVLAALKDRSATATVAVTSEAIPAGQPVTASEVRWVTVHRSDGALVSGLLGRAELDEHWVAAVRIPVGAPLTMSELTLASPTAGLGSMSIQVPVSRADGGAIEPGDRVDVISAASGQAVYVAADLEVLAVADQRSGVLGGISEDSYFVTVAVDRATALQLAAAIGASDAEDSSSIEVVLSTGEGPYAVTPTAAPSGGPGNSAGRS